MSAPAGIVLRDRDGCAVSTVPPEHRGRGLSKRLMDCVTAHPDLQGLRRWILLTGDATGLCRRSGFTALAKPERWMERWDPEAYRH